MDIDIINRSEHKDNRKALFDLGHWASYVAISLLLFEISVGGQCLVCSYAENKPVACSSDRFLSLTLVAKSFIASQAVLREVTSGWASPVSFSKSTLTTKTFKQKVISSSSLNWKYKIVLESGTIRLGHTRCFFDKLYKLWVFLFGFLVGIERKEIIINKSRIAFVEFVDIL